MKKEECFFLGKISRKHGYKGELNIKLDVISSPEFKELSHLFIDMNGSLVPFFISTFRFKNKGIALVKFEDVNSDEEATSLINKETYLPINFLPEDESPFIGVINFSISDLKHRNLGKVVNIQDNSGQQLFVIDFKGKEILIPIAEPFIHKIDKEKKEIVLDTPDGLIDLYL
ncbi:MAG: 16S rRNA processing protein RimM [Flavobacteriales bacterium]|nr:16S rRNA processing protein RimM [Flavobacteriales bacterium]